MIEANKTMLKRLHAQQTKGIFQILQHLCRMLSIISTKLLTKHKENHATSTKTITNGAESRTQCKEIKSTNTNSHGSQAVSNIEEARIANTSARNTSKSPKNIAYIKKSATGYCRSHNKAAFIIFSEVQTLPLKLLHTLQKPIKSSYRRINARHIPSIPAAHSANNDLNSEKEWQYLRKAQSINFKNQKHHIQNHNIQTKKTDTSEFFVEDSKNLSLTTRNQTNLSINTHFNKKKNFFNAKNNTLQAIRAA